jgi:hypothetical protein
METLTATFLDYFRILKAAVAPNMSMQKDRFDFLDFVWHYVFRLHRRLNILIAQWRNGTLPTPGAPRPASNPARNPANARTARTPPRFRFPGGRRWLFRVLPGNGVIRSRLQHILANDAEFAAFLAAAPQARSMLNTLCRMLGIDFDKPFGVPLFRPPVSPGSVPESAANSLASCESAPESAPDVTPPRTLECPAQSADTAPNPTKFFSSP